MGRWMIYDAGTVTVPWPCRKIYRQFSIVESVKVYLRIHFFNLWLSNSGEIFSAVAKKFISANTTSFDLKFGDNLFQPLQKVSFIPFSQNKFKKQTKRVIRKNNSAVLLRFRFKIKIERIEQNWWFKRKKNIQTYVTLGCEFKIFILITSTIF